MIDMIDLESRWRKYKIKSYVPYAIIAFSIIVITIISITFFNSTDKKSVAHKDTKIKNNIILEKKIKINTTKPIKKNTKDIIKKINIKEVPEKKIIKKEPTKEPTKAIQKLQQEGKLLLSPSLNFMKYMQSNTPDYYEGEVIKTENTETKTTKAKITQTKSKEIQKNVVIEIDKKNKNMITRNKQSTLKDIQEVIKRFKINNNPALSLFIAKKYYELGQYNKSYNYALITNEINPNIEKSWIIFAKSLVKLNEKEMAIKTLKRYIQHSQSNDAKILLNNINSGKFK